MGGEVAQTGDSQVRGPADRVEVLAAGAEKGKEIRDGEYWNVQCEGEGGLGGAARAPAPTPHPHPHPHLLMRRNVHGAATGRDLEMWGTGRVEPPAAKSKETLQQRSPGLLTRELLKAPSSHCVACRCQSALLVFQKNHCGTGYGKVNLHGGLSLHES